MQTSSSTVLPSVLMWKPFRMAAEPALDMLMFSIHQQPSSSGLARVIPSYGVADLFSVKNHSVLEGPVKIYAQNCLQAPAE